MLEAVWDPVAGKVVFTEKGKLHASSSCNEEKAAAQNSTEKKKRDSRSKQSIDENNLQWRNNISSSGLRRPRSKGIAPSQFHQPANVSDANNSAAISNNNSSKPGQEAVEKLHDSIQQRVIQQQTVAARKQQDYQRQAFKLLTVQKTYPLQERALSHFRELRTEWGIVEEMERGDEKPLKTTDSACATAGASSSSSSSSRTASSLDVPEAKRCLRDQALSPTQSRMLQQYHSEFLQQRAIPHNSTTTNVGKFGPALWCLEPRVFSVESGTHGRRRYLVSHAGRFFDAYWRKTEACARHAYELIRPHTPCRLYLDLECSVSDNPVFGSNSQLQEQLLTELFEELSSELQDQYGRNNGYCTTRKSNIGHDCQLQALQRHHVVDLDSSTDTKFSRHWIVHLPVTDGTAEDESSPQQQPREALFADVAAAGYFVREWVGRMAEQQATGQLKRKSPALHEHLFVQTQSKSAVDGTSCLIDTGVYTRNRLFRLMGSSKFGKPVTAALRIAATNQFPFPNAFGNDSFYIPEMTHHHTTPADDSTGRHTDARRVSDVDSEVLKSLAQTDWTMHAEALAATLIVPLNGAKIDYPILPRLAAASNDEVAGTKPAGHKVSRSASSLSIGKSPYPMVDDFVYNYLANRGDTQGDLRAWSIDSDSATGKPIMLSYQISRNRWCECVGRAHKSNNITWHVDIRMLFCFQTCYDPDCRSLNFRGRPVPLPPPVRDALQDALFEEELARLDLVNPNESAPPVQPQTYDDISGDSDDSFEKALAALNLDELVMTSTCGGVKTSTSSKHDLDPCEPESSADHWRRLHGDVVDDDSSDISSSSDLECRSSSVTKLVVRIPVSARPQSNPDSSKHILRSNTDDADDEKSSSADEPHRAKFPSALRPLRPKSSGTDVSDEDSSDEDDDLVALARMLEQRKKERELTQQKVNSGA